LHKGVGIKKMRMPKALFMCSVILPGLERSCMFGKLCFFTKQGVSAQDINTGQVLTFWEFDGSAYCRDSNSGWNNCNVYKLGIKNKHYSSSFMRKMICRLSS
jgi:hypothetical protein